jgi:hypothetical protein
MNIVIPKIKITILAEEFLPAINLRYQVTSYENPNEEIGKGYFY